MHFAGAVLVFAQLVRAYDDRYLYPELRSDLQEYQDSSRCYPNDGNWHLMYRNYDYDPNMGGEAKCVTFSTFGKYENFTTPANFAYGYSETVRGTLTLGSSSCYTAKNKKEFVPNDDNASSESFHAIFMDCESCFVGRHPNAGDGRGCTLWRRYDSLDRRLDYCEFIYDENCGSSPKYKMYDSTCTWETTSLTEAPEENSEALEESSEAPEGNSEAPEESTEAPE
nr:uncharacterized protein LOC129388108 [Dermacentor andersoni]